MTFLRLISKRILIRGLPHMVLLLQPYVDLPFPLVNHVVSTIFQGKQKHLHNTVRQLFPSNLARALGKSSYVSWGRGGGGGFQTFSQCCGSGYFVTPWILDTDPGSGMEKIRS